MKKVFEHGRPFAFTSRAKLVKILLEVLYIKRKNERKSSI